MNIYFTIWIQCMIKISTNNLGKPSKKCNKCYNDSQTGWVSPLFIGLLFGAPFMAKISMFLNVMLQVQFKHCNFSGSVQSSMSHNVYLFGTCFSQVSPFSSLHWTDGA